MAKAKVKFADANVTVTVPVGTRLVELSEKAGSYIAYNCREGDCGSCVCTVIDGEKNLSALSELEKNTLLAHFKQVLDGWRRIDDLDTLLTTMQHENFIGKHCRLACQTQVFGDATVAPL